MPKHEESQNWAKEAHTCEVEPEALEKCDPYAFTLNPKDPFQSFKSNSTRRFFDFKHQMETTLYSILRPFASYSLIIEISKKGRLHMHGTIVINDRLGFFLSAIPKLMELGTYKLAKLADRKVWSIYCHKQDYLFDGYETEITSKEKLPVMITPISSWMNDD